MPLFQPRHTESGQDSLTFIQALKKYFCIQHRQTRKQIGLESYLGFTPCGLLTRHCQGCKAMWTISWWRNTCLSLVTILWPVSYKTALSHDWGGEVKKGTNVYIPYRGFTVLPSDAMSQECCKDKMLHWVIRSPRHICGETLA